MHEVYGEAGDVWTANLPSLLQACAERWSLRIDPPFALTYNYVAPATRADGTHAVLKVGYPSPEYSSELPALRLYAGAGMAALLESDEAWGAMLIERCEPGTTLEDMDDAEATRIAAAVMRQLRQPPPAGHTFRHVRDWGRGFERLHSAFDGATGPFDAGMVARAERLFAELLASAGPDVVLHGDLHHANILRASRGWLAIDPKGILGPPEYEVAPFLYNPMSLYTTNRDPVGTLRRRIDMLCEELGFERERVRSWAFAQSVLSAWWTWEDHGKVGEWAMRCAGWLQELGA
jgi:streptomycin 6-kinase